MAGYSFEEVLHDNQAITVTQLYTRSLPDFRSLTYNFFLNGSIVGTGFMLINVSLGSSASANRIYTSRRLSLINDRDSVTIVLPGETITIQLLLSGFTSVNISDSIVANG